MLPRKCKKLLDVGWGGGYTARPIVNYGEGFGVMFSPDFLVRHALIAEARVASASLCKAIALAAAHFPPSGTLGFDPHDLCHNYSVVVRRAEMADLEVERMFAVISPLKACGSEITQGVAFGAVFAAGGSVLAAQREQNMRVIWFSNAAEFALAREMEPFVAVMDVANRRIDRVTQILRGETLGFIKAALGFMRKVEVDCSGAVLPPGRFVSPWGVLAGRDRAEPV